jgi:hypothetical protein
MSNCGDEECATDKTEAKEFAYFSGLLSGRKNERERIIKLLKDYAFNNGHSGGILFAVALIKGEHK